MEEESSNVLPKAITMTICLSDAGKRFNRDWIFRHVNYTFEAGQSYAITGPNGSGKSTLLQVLSGGMMINEGVIEFEVRSQESGLPSVALAKEGVRLALRSFSEGGSQESGLPSVALAKEGVRSSASGFRKQSTIISTENIYQQVSICAPYLEVVEEMTVREFLDFHKGFKPFLPGVTTDTIISTIGLEEAVNKQIRYYSSGMKQRVKLAQCIFSDTAIVLLDEPCTNLDKAGIELYDSLINAYCKNRLVVVSSNDEEEYKFCQLKINISDYK